MWKSEQPPDAVLSPTWSLTDVRGSLDILPAAHHKRTHHRAVAAVIRGCFPIGSDHTWRRAVEADLGQQNIGLASAWRKAAIRDDWRRIVDTATLQWSTLSKKKEKANDQKCRSPRPVKPRAGMGFLGGGSKPSSHQLRDLGERCKLPQRVRGGALPAKRFLS